MPETTYAEAARFKLTFGRYKGAALDDIARSDAGLLYLDWLRGEYDKSKPADATKSALCAYLDNPTIAKDLSRLVITRPRHEHYHRD
jgi:hypothetical protein